MSEENQEPQEQAQQAQQAPQPQELNLEQSFNLLVNLARQSKLTYEEHSLVDKAVQQLSSKLEIGG